MKKANAEKRVDLPPAPDLKGKWVVVCRGMNGEVTSYADHIGACEPWEVAASNFLKTYLFSKKEAASVAESIWDVTTTIEKAEDHFKKHYDFINYQGKVKLVSYLTKDGMAIVPNTIKDAKKTAVNGMKTLIEVTKETAKHYKQKVKETEKVIVGIQKDLKRLKSEW